jgi:4-amino-4-deoxy-L-arabinose transferase-like glycosyltransferase
LVVCDGAVVSEVNRSSATLVVDAEAPSQPTEDEPRTDPIPIGRVPLTQAQTRWLVGIVALAAVLRVGWLVLAHVDPPVHFMESGDQYSYWYHANEIAAGRGYHSYITGEATAYYPIGYPALLAGLFWLANRVPFVDPDLMLVAGAFHVIVSVATVALTFVVGRRLLGARAGLVAAALMAVFPNLVYQVTSLQLETTFVFLTIAALAVIVDHDWSSGPPSRNRLLAFGAVLAASALVRPFSVPLLVGLLLALLAMGLGLRRALAALSVPVLVLVVAFTPWTIRNAVQLDGFVPSSTNMGDTLCIDRNLDATGGFRWSTHDGCVDPDLPEVERNRGNTRKAIEFVAEHPGRELLQVVRRGRFMFAEDHDGILAVETMGSGPIFSDGTRTVLETVADWYFFVALAAAVIGLPWLVRRPPRPERWLVLSVLVALLVIPLLLWGNPRFHLPLAPFIALSAGALVTVARTES